MGGTGSRNDLGGNHYCECALRLAAEHRRASHRCARVAAIVVGDARAFANGQFRRSLVDRKGAHVDGIDRIGIRQFARTGAAQFAGSRLVQLRETIEPGLAERFYCDPHWPFQLARYLVIGSVATAVDIGTFAGLLRLHWPLLAAITAAYACAVGLHFSFNKYLNFRSHSRPLHSQGAIYAAVALFCWLVTAAIVTTAAYLGIAPLIGKCIAVGVNIPLGFIGHRTFTFGRGIRL
jgi:putative flippase GtrA